MSYNPNQRNSDRGSTGFQGNRDQMQNNRLADEFKPDWISQRINSDCINYTEKAGIELVKQRFTTSQIRNVFGEIKRIQMKGYRENKTAFLLLKPKLAYAAKRASTNGAETFRLIITKAHDAVKVDEQGEETRFANFCDFVEAILAYHKGAGGK